MQVAPTGGRGGVSPKALLLQRLLQRTGIQPGQLGQRPAVPAAPRALPPIQGLIAQPSQHPMRGDVQPGAFDEVPGVPGVQGMPNPQLGRPAIPGQDVRGLFQQMLQQILLRHASPETQHPQRPGPAPLRTAFPRGPVQRTAQPIQRHPY